MSQPDTEYQVARALLERLYEELTIIESQLHPAISRLRSLLGELLGYPPPTPTAPPPTPTPEEAPKIIIPETIPKEAVTTTVKKATLDDILNVLLKILEQISEGVKTRRYTTHYFKISPNPITYEGSFLDLGDVFDSAIIVPTIDAQIEIDKPVETTTPIIYGNTALNLDNTKIRTIYYKGVSKTLRGTLLVWAFKY